MNYLLLLRTNSSETSFDENIRQFKSRLHGRGYPDTPVNKVLSEVKFEERKSTLQQKERKDKKILPFVTQYHQAVPNLKKILMSKWHLIQNQPLLREVCKEPPTVSRAKELNRSKISDSFDPNSRGKEYTFAHNRSRAGLLQ